MSIKNKQLLSTISKQEESPNIAILPLVSLI